MEFEESLEGDLWTQSLTLTNNAINEALQEMQDLTHDQSSQMLLAKGSLAEPSLVKPNLVELNLAKLSLAELSLIELSLVKSSLTKFSLVELSLAESSLAKLQNLDQYDWSNFDKEFLINRSCSLLDWSFSSSSSKIIKYK